MKTKWVLLVMLGLLVVYDWSFSRDTLDSEDFVASFDKTSPDESDVMYHLDTLTANKAQLDAALNYYYLALLVTEKDVEMKNDRIVLANQLDEKRQQVIESYRLSEKNVATYDQVLKYVADTITSDDKRYNRWYQIQLAGQGDLNQRVVKVSDMHASYSHCQLGTFC
ncbi:hypothetical protein VTH8203_02439 [Vibrio thalassae]|uniref:Uncharacterized protein n=1 Tax=Vibrio thalassae TaxID=1243014 RepID=A0A240EJE2_9VIBR|nr:hypothetical protein [Vibrio thalassae]SNX48802.1 hypothetical protein VTH8203_02439 [Vibrio thalassae]